MTAEGGLVIMPYEEIDTEFDSIENGTIQIHAPKAIVKKASWNGSDGKIDIPDVEYKYKGCKTITDIKAIDENYLENDIVDGKWTELLSDLTNSNGMFTNSENLVIFDSDLSSLNYSYNMFRDCSNLTTFTSDLSSLTDSGNMFSSCLKLSDFEGDLSSLTAGWNMFYECSNLTTFTIDLPSLTNGNYMFSNCSNLEYFDSDLKSLTICTGMFMNCVKLTTFISNLSSLITGNSMFQNCSNLTTFTSDLSSLTNGNSMFFNCSALVHFSSNLKSLTNGQSMFYGSGIITFDLQLPSLTTAQSMFNNCYNLNSFKSNTKSLSDAHRMFFYCLNLTSFSSNLKSLTIGIGMFFNCKLDVSSVKNIIHTINTVETGEITIGMGCDNNSQDKDLFAQEVGYTDMSSLLATLRVKGWTVGAQYNGRPSTNYSLRQPQSLPVFVKLVEVIPTDENSFYEYTSQDNTKFYNLDWFHETTGSTDTYTQFNSLEEAITTFNIKPIEK